MPRIIRSRRPLRLPDDRDRGAGLTSFYSWRLIFKTFFGEPHDQEHYEAAHEAPLTMLIPLGVLAVGAIAPAFAVQGLFVGRRRRGVLPRVGEDEPAYPRGHGARAASAGSLLPTVMMVLGFAASPTCSTSAGRICRSNSPNQQPMLYQFLLNKWYFDELYDFIFVRPAKWIGRFLWKVGDGYIIDGFGPTASRRGCSTSPATWCGCRPATLSLRLRDADRRRGA
jgi:NADH-quinone oxidoreductase subunit L